MEQSLTNTVSDLYATNNLNFFRGRYNIIDCGVRTGKTYWAINNLINFTRDGEPRRILFLVDTTALKDNIIATYPGQCCDADSFWCRKEHTWTIEDRNKIGIMCYQALGAKVIKEDLDFLEAIDVICWDECDSIFDFAASAFAKARKLDYSRKASSNGEILALIQEHSSRMEYMPLILLGYWEKIIQDNRILCIGLSATPERARIFYDSIVSASNQGKLETTYRAASDIYFKDVIEHIHNLTPMPGHGYWCYSPSIEHNLAIVRAAKQQGFNPIELHSSNNKDKPLTEEQLRVINTINSLGMVPTEYDFIVVTRFLERGINIRDGRFTNLIVDSYLQEDRQQAARQLFPYQRHVKVLATSVPEEFLNRWLTVDKCRELAEYMAVPDINVENISNGRTQARIMSWNKLQEVLPKFGYSVEKKRKRLGGNPVQAYYITGAWHDVEVIGGKDFMELVAAKIEEDNVQKLEA